MSIRILDKTIELPELYPNVKRKLKTAKTGGYDIVGGFKIRKDIDIMPQVGMQEDVCACECNLIFMCGQGTAGKTFTMYLKALNGMDMYGFTSRLISVRAMDSQKGSSIYRDGVTVLGNFGGCDYASSGTPTFAYPKNNSNLQLIHSNFNVAIPKEWKEFQDYAKKQQSSLIMVDECTEMDYFKMFAFWFMRNRDNSGMIPQMICSFNPLYGHWTNDMLIESGSVDTSVWHLKKDAIGKVKYFYVLGDEAEDIVWGDTREEVVRRAGLQDNEDDLKAGITKYDYVKSFAVFTAAAADNRELVNATGGQSVANLHAVGATQRMVVGEAYFGPTEKETKEVSNNMIEQLFENAYDEGGERYATMDISSGKEENDKAPMIIWDELSIVAIEWFEGKPSEMEGWLRCTLKKHNVPIEHFAFDATGHGYWVQAFSSGIPVTWNKKVIQEYDENGNQVALDEFFNLRSQLLGKTRVLIEKGDISIRIDKNTEYLYGRRGEKRKLISILLDESNLFISLKRNKKTYYRSTDEFKQKFKFSPDLMTTIALRAIFELDARERKHTLPEVTEDAYDEFCMCNTALHPVMGIWH